MARYREYSYEQNVMLPIDFKSQILPGTFEYALNHIVDKEIDASVFEAWYRNDETGAPAIDPGILLKIVLYAYSRGIISSRKISERCRENVIFMALSADTRPHFTTIADFILRMGGEIKSIFRDVLLICDEMDLIGRDMFAIDGCKIASNASKEWSGTRADFIRKKEKLEKSIAYIMEKHQARDQEEEAGPVENEHRHVEKLRQKAEKIRKWLEENEDNRSPKGQIRKSNITDKESAKMVSSHGVIQGYNGIAVVDSKHQVVVYPEAFGEGQEHNLLKPALEGTRSVYESGKDIFKEVTLVADSGFHSEENMKMLIGEENIDAYVPDNLFRKRDPRFTEAVRHRPESRARRRYFRPCDFAHDAARKTCVCPAGKAMYVKDSRFKVKGYKGIVYMAKITDCRACLLRKQCLRNPGTPARQVTFFYGRDESHEKKETFTQKMIRRIDSIKGRYLYSRRMGIVEPVFANIRSNLGLNRFTLRGKKKVNIQWILFSIVHNIGKIYRYGPALA